MAPDFLDYTYAESVVDYVNHQRKSEPLFEPEFKTVSFILNIMKSEKHAPDEFKNIKDAMASIRDHRHYDGLLLSLPRTFR